MHWWYEATANWMETQVFPDLPDNLESAGAVFKSPDTCMLRYGGVNRVESGLHWYGMWVFNQMLAEEYGPEIIRDIWLRLADAVSMRRSMKYSLQRGTSFEDEMRRFALNVLLRDFANGQTITHCATAGSGRVDRGSGLQQMACSATRWTISGWTSAAPYTITLTSDDPGIEGMVVGVRGTSADVFDGGRRGHGRFRRV